MRNVIIFLVMVSFSQLVFAIQTTTVKDNETVTAKISSIDLTRITVEGDRIKSLRGIRGAYTHENDEIKGDVYIQPTNDYQTRAFTVLVETELGHHFTLLLHPMAVPADTLLILLTNYQLASVEHFEKAASYELSLIQLIRLMKKNLPVEGYNLHHVNHAKPYTLNGQEVINLKSILIGDKVDGEIFELANTSSSELLLDERQFYKNGTLAISLDNTIVPSHNKIHIYRVVNHVR